MDGNLRNYCETLGLYVMHCAEPNFTTGERSAVISIPFPTHPAPHSPHRIMTLQIAPTPLWWCAIWTADMVKWKDASWGHKQEQEKKLTDWRQKSLVPSFSFHIWEICEQEMGQDEKQLRMCDNQANGSISCMLEIRMKESSNETWSVSCWRCSFSLRGDACCWCN